MEKKQLFDSTLVGFHPEVFNSYLQISVDIGDNNYTSNFNINQTITVDDDFINNYNNTPVNSVGVLAINMTYNGDQTVRHIMNFIKGSEGSYANHIRKGFIYCISINNINTIDKTIDLIISSRSDNTIVKLTTTINRLTDLTPGDFNETVTLTAEEYNAFSEILVGEIFTLVNSDNAVYFTIKNSYKSFRANRYYINSTLTNKFLVSFIIDLGENNQATFIGNVTRLMDFNNYLAKDNTTEYIPTSDYNPTTKKYVDDKDNTAKLRLYNGKISLQHGAGKSLINDTCESFADFIAVFDDMTQLDGTSLTNPFTGMTLPTNVNEFIEAFQTFQSTYNVYDGGYLVHPMIGAHASDENIIIVGFYRHNIGPAEIQFGDVSYLNWQANSVFGIGINSSTGNYVQIDNYQISTLSLDRGLVANLIHKINNLDLSNYIAKNNTVAYTPTGDYNPATKKYVDEQIASIEGNNSNVDNVPAFRLQGTINSANANEGVILADIYRSGNTDIIDNLQDGNYVGVLIAIDITDSNDSKQYRGVISGFVRKNMTSGEEIILTTDLSTGGLVFNTVSCPQKINYSYDDTNSPNSLITEFQNISLHKGTTCELLWKYTRRVLTESEYAALGTAPETDNVLYFVTPD